MKIKVIPSSWISRVSRRLDPGPYLSDGLEYRIRLDRLALRKDRLIELTENGKDGIFIAPYFKRNYVDDPEHGVPLLGNTDILMSNPLLTASFIPKKTYEQLQEGLQLKAGWTLITCFGTVGNMAYCRLDMESCAGSTNFMRVVPDSRKVLSGYLYAFLSSKFGRALITQSETGSVIPNLLPSQIADLPVPRLGDAIEQRAHALVEEAAQLRVQASCELTAAIHEVQEHANLTSLPKVTSPMPYSITTTSSSTVKERLDAFFHSRYHTQAIEQLKNAGIPLKKVRDIASSIVEPTRFKRVPLEDPAHGVPFFGTSALMWNEPQPSYYLPRRQKGIEEYLVTEQVVLVPRSGQLSGIIGMAVLPYGRLINGAITEDAIRINCGDERDAGFLYIFLSSSFGIRQLKARAYGTSIPHLDVKQIGEVLVPNLGEHVQKQIGQRGLDVSYMRNEAIYRENEAIRLVEQAIEEAA